MKIKIIFFALILSFVTSFALAADTLVKMDIKSALEDPKIQNTIYNDIKLYWGSDKHPKVIKNFGEFSTSKRANKLGKSREQACKWALASSIKVLQERARKEGGNAVIKIKSNIKHNEVSSASSYECLCGNMMVNVVLKGTVVKLAK